MFIYSTIGGVRDYWIGASNIDHRDYFGWGVDGDDLRYGYNNFPDAIVPDPYQGWDECVAAARERSGHKGVRKEYHI